MGVDGKVHTQGKHRGPVYVKESGTDGKAFDFCHRRKGHVRFRDIIMCKMFQILTPFLRARKRTLYNKERKQNRVSDKR